jgi:hypothetical protein
MRVKYKKNKRTACYDSDSLISGNKSKAEPRLRRPFLSCGDCAYPSHGFKCYSSGGDCLRTYMQKMNQRRKMKVL